MASLDSRVSDLERQQGDNTATIVTFVDFARPGGLDEHPQVYRAFKNAGIYMVRQPDEGREAFKARVRATHPGVTLWLSEVAAEPDKT